ncbi:Lrp/AsnC family transcriptional regulator [Zobellella denitrificans]|jgi:DNA-binding Lrp family transcriptional regulator
MSDNLDQFDRKILAIVQRNCLTRSEVIAEEIGLSPSAVQRRLKRLRQSRVISADVAVVDNRKLDNLMTFIVGLEIERENYPVMDRFMRWAQGQDAFQQIFYVTGAVDLVAVILARDVTEFDAIAEATMSQFPEIKRMNTNVVLNVLKSGLHLPL